MAFRPLFVFAIAILPVVGCRGPEVPSGSPRIVRAKDLVNDYLSDRPAARVAYDDQLLQVSVGAYVVSGHEVHYLIRYDDQPRRPVIVFRFDETPKLPNGQLWIEGHCTGCTDDKEDRGLPGYTFTVTLTHCRIVSPPVRSTP